MLKLHLPGYYNSIGLLGPWPAVGYFACSGCRPRGIIFSFACLVSISLSIFTLAYIISLFWHVTIQVWAMV
ncbi:hypothetical protein F4779DRAFT_575688 [Xylariaceae sp. FL0662B]|nr:hypothetical protein F4779DRAFT_575688 [Xylariaceae sp. FL0662B]